MKKLIIAIDGTAGSGKSTTARLVARRLNYLHIDTGAMYRAAAYAVLKENINPDDKKAVEELIDRLKIRLRQSNGMEVLLNDEPVTNMIRTNGVTAIVSKVSSYERVRAKMAEEQRTMGKAGGVVLEGRDIGTVVFPEADIKSRDYHDSTRALSPLIKAEEAITIDTSKMTIDEQVEKVLSIISERQNDQ